MNFWRAESGALMIEIWILLRHYNVSFILLRWKFDGDYTNLLQNIRSVENLRRGYSRFHFKEKTPRTIRAEMLFHNIRLDNKQTDTSPRLKVNFYKLPNFNSLFRELGLLWNSHNFPLNEVKWISVLFIFILILQLDLPFFSSKFCSTNGFREELVNEGQKLHLKKFFCKWQVELKFNNDFWIEINLNFVFMWTWT